MVAYKEIVASKRANREKAVESGGPYAQEHSEFLKATGTSKAFR
jgi:hypothetical protein